MRYELGGLLHGGAFFRNFMVIVPNMTYLDSELLAFLVISVKNAVPFIALEIDRFMKHTKNMKLYLVKS